MLGRQINLSVEELNHLGLCGMMHDMGIMRIPLEALNKSGKLTPEEQQLMRSHTTQGWKLLMSSSGMYGGAIDVAYTHDERINGKGYPRQLSEGQISPCARMVAITSGRVYRDGKTHLEAINILIKAGGILLDSALTIKFIQCLGIYPPESIVE